MIQSGGKTWPSYPALAAYLGISRSALLYRRKKYGLEYAIKWPSRGKKYPYKGNEYTIHELWDKFGAEIGLSEQNIRDRLASRWSIEDSVETLRYACRESRRH